jgi:isochorismate hydrolase
VLATYIGAIDRDLSPYLVRDAVAASREEHEMYSLKREYYCLQGAEKKAS